MISNLFQGGRMRSKQAKVFSLILATAITSTFTALPYTTKAMTEKNGVIYVTNKDVKNGKVVISNKTAKSIVIKKSAGKAIIKLKGVKLSGELKIEKGDYILKTSRTKIKNLKISGKDTNIKFDKSSDLNKKSFVLKIAKNTTGSIDLSEFGKKVTTELGKNSDINIKVGNNDKASIVVKKSSTASKLELTGANEDASISKIRVESPVKLTVKVNALTLETAKKAAKAEITIENKVSEVKNDAGALVFDKEAERQKAEKEKEDREREEKAKEDKAKEDKLKEEKAKEAANTGGGYSGGGSSNPSIPEKKTESITLTKDGDIKVDCGKTKVKVTYNPVDAADKNLEWTIKEGVGIAKIISSNSNEAEIEALADGNCKIEARIKGSNVKADVTIEIKNQDSKALENRIKEYLTYTVDKLNKDNYADVLKMSDDLDKDITAKINANNDKAKWEEYQKKVKAKVTELEGKILTLKNAETAAAGVIGNAYNDISTGSDLDPDTAKTAVETIEGKRKDVSEKAFKGKVTDENRYNEIKAEVEEYNKVKDAINNKPTIGETGVVFFYELSVSSKYDLIKEGSSNKIIDGSELKAKEDKINLLKQMRNGGVGKYTVRHFKAFKHLKDVEIGKSDEKEVKLLEKKWGGDNNTPPVYDYDGTKFNLETGKSNTIRFKEESGRWILEWDAVENATTYDIIATISFGNNEGNLGSYNLTSTAVNYENIENEFDYTKLNSINKKVNDNTNQDKRTMVAVNHPTTSIGLDGFVPVKGKVIDNDFWKKFNNDNVTVDIWIIPRNQNSLYISNMRDYISNPQTDVAKRNKLFIQENVSGKFKLKDFYKIFYGEELTQ